jgi:hypothetical protein
MWYTKVTWVIALVVTCGMVADALGQGDPCWKVPCVEWNCRYWQDGQGQDVCFASTQDTCLGSLYSTWADPGTQCKEKIPLVTITVKTCPDCSDYCPGHAGQARVCGYPTTLPNCHTPVTAYQKSCSSSK